MTDNNANTAEREAIEAMLPWYEAGQLDAADARRVEAYIADHPEVAGQLALITEERAETVLANEARGAPRAGALDRLMADIEEHEAANPSLAGAKTALTGWLSRLLGVQVPAAAQWAAAAAAVVIVAQGITLGVLMTSGTGQGPAYETASGPAQTAVRGTFALVQFAQDASAEQITGFLDENDMTIIDGPKPGGVYKVRISPRTLEEAERNTILRELRENDALIVFAEPAE